MLLAVVSEGTSVAREDEDMCAASALSLSALRLAEEVDGVIPGISNKFVRLLDEGRPDNKLFVEETLGISPASRLFEEDTVGNDADFCSNGTKLEELLLFVMKPSVARSLLNTEVSADDVTLANGAVAVEGPIP